MPEEKSKTLMNRSTPIPALGFGVLQNILSSVTKNLGPVHDIARMILNNKVAFEHMTLAVQQMKHLHEVISKNYAMTIPAIRAVNELTSQLRGISGIIAPLYSVSTINTEEVIVRPAITEAKSIVRQSLPRKKEIIPLQLPTNVKWEHVRGRFIDGHNLFIEIPNQSLKFVADYKDMGMSDDRTGLPNKQWDLLVGLAGLGGEITWQDSIAHPRVKKQKQFLSEALKRYFRIQNDPFDTYRKARAYRLKMILQPQLEAVENESDPIGIDDYLKETGKSIYDPKDGHR